MAKVGRLASRMYLDEGGGIPPRGLIGNPQIQGRLVRSLGLRERAPAPTITPEIQPVVIVEDLSKIEESNLRSRRACVGAAQGPAADGASGSTVALFNPPGSGIFIKIKKQDIDQNLSDVIMGEILAGAPIVATESNSETFANLQVGTFGGPRPTGRILFGLDSVPTEPSIRLRGVSNNYSLVDEPLILIPNSHMVWTGVITGGTFVTATFWWDEYEIEGLSG